MVAIDIFLLLTLISLLGTILFVGSAIINLFRRGPAKEDWLKAFIFFALSILFFVFFGFSL